MPKTWTTRSTRPQAPASGSGGTLSAGRPILAQSSLERERRRPVSMDPIAAAWTPNFGSRADCQGWGRGVVTTGYDDLFKHPAQPLNEDYWYTAKFSGTSSASPIVVGAVACLQGVARHRGRTLMPQEVRHLLRTTGSPQQAGVASPVSQRIGSRPDLRQMLGTAFGIA